MSPPILGAAAVVVLFVLLFARVPVWAALVAGVKPETVTVARVGAEDTLMRLPEIGTPEATMLPAKVTPVNWTPTVWPESFSPLAQVEAL